MVPQTPPRSSKRVTLQTPQETPQNIINKKFKSNLINEVTPKKEVKLVYHTPVSVKKDGTLFTPASLKKDVKIDKPNNLPMLSTNLFKLTNEEASSTKKSNNFGLLLPLPSNIGKGRKLRTNKKISTNNRLNLDFFMNINQDFQFEQDLVEEHERKLLQEAAFHLTASSKEFMIKSNNISKEIFNRKEEVEDDDKELDEDDDDDEDEYQPDEFDSDQEYKHKDKHKHKVHKSKKFSEESIFNPIQNTTPKSTFNQNSIPQFPTFDQSTSNTYAPQNTSQNTYPQNAYPQNTYASYQNVPMNYDAPVNYQNYNQNMYNAYDQNIYQVPINYQKSMYAPPFSATPQTPGKQVITQDLINDWYHETPKYEQSNYDDIKSTQMDLPNPFIDNKENKQNRFNISNNNLSNSINYATHMEKINNKTGERIVEELSSAQQAIKPKKLDFSQFK